MCVCVCVCVWLEAGRRQPSLSGLGGGQLGRKLVGSILALPILAGWASLGEVGAWLPAYKIPCDGLWSLMCWAWDHTWLAGVKTEPVCRDVCLFMVRGERS